MLANKISVILCMIMMAIGYFENSIIIVAFFGFGALLNFLVDNKR